MAAIWVVQAELSGFGAGWTTITDITDTPIVIERRFQTSSPIDLVQSPATCTFDVDNSPTNSGSKRGYYSPDSSNLRSGWAEGIRIRVQVTANSVTRTRFIGFLEDTIPDAGIFETQVAHVTCLSWLGHAATAGVDGLPAEINRRGDQILPDLVALVPFQPPATQYATTIDTYPFAGDNLDPNKSTVMDGIDSLCRSGLDRVWEKADGTLVLESRMVRASQATSLLTLTDVASAGNPGRAIVGLPLQRSRKSHITRVQCTVHPKRVDAAAVVLYALQVSGSTATVPPNGGTLTITGTYVDPQQVAQRVGGTNMLISDGGSGSVIGTSGNLPTGDFQLFSLPGGMGTDITNSCTVAVTYSNGQVTFVITNNSVFDGNIFKLQCHGIGIYDYQTVTAIIKNTSVETSIGRNQIQFDCPWQSDPLFASGAAALVLNLLSQQTSQIDEVPMFITATDEVTMDSLLQREISDPIGVTETQTGVSNVPFWINGVREEIDERGNLLLSWALMPRDNTQYWLIGVTGASEIGNTTTVAYV